MFDDGLATHIFLAWAIGTLYSGCALGRLVSRAPVGWKYASAYVIVAGLLIALSVWWGIHHGALEYSDNYGGHWMLPAMILVGVAGISGGTHARLKSPSHVQQWKLGTVFMVVAACCGLVFLNAGPHKRSTIVVTAEDGTKHLNHNNKKRFGWPWEINGSFPVFLANAATGASAVLILALLTSQHSPTSRRHQTERENPE